MNKIYVWTLITAATFIGAATAADRTCTNGQLYISETETAVVHVYNLDDDFLTEQATVEIPSMAGQYLEASGTAMSVTSTYWGSEDEFYLDGNAHFIATGVSTETKDGSSYIVKQKPSVAENGFLDCGPIWHVTMSDQWIAMQCEGGYDAVPPVNTSVYIVDESLLGTNGNPVVSTVYLPGSHHAFAVTVHGTYIVQTMPTTDRIHRVDDGTPYPSLSDTFSVFDFQGTVVQSFDDLDDPARHCSDAHGINQVGDTVALLCSAGIVVVDYDPADDSFTSRFLPYPQTPLINHRAAGVAAHPLSDYFVVDYGDWDAEVYVAHLISFKRTAKNLVGKDVLQLENGHCYFGFEKSTGDLMVVLTPMGEVQVYGLDPTWMLVAETKVGENITSCEMLSLHVGYGYAFVVAFDSSTIYAVDMYNAIDGKLDVAEAKLDYAPNSVVAAGVPDGMSCSRSKEEENVNPDPDDDNVVDDTDHSDFSDISRSAVTNRALVLQEVMSMTSSSGSDLSSRMVMINQDGSDGSFRDGTAIGLMYCNNELVLPAPRRMMGTKSAGKITGHCVQIAEQEAVCYLSLRIMDSPQGSGRISIEVYYPSISSYENADVIITGGSGDFMGIVGRGYTSLPPDDTDERRVNYHLDFKIVV